MWTATHQVCDTGIVGMYKSSPMQQYIHVRYSFVIQLLSCLYVTLMQQGWAGWIRGVVPRKIKF